MIIKMIKKTRLNETRCSRRDVGDSVADEYALQVDRVAPRGSGNAILIIYVACKHRQVLPCVRLAGEMQRAPSELGERLEEDGDESVNVPCGIFCCFNGFAVVCIGEPNANSKKPRTVR